MNIKIEIENCENPYCVIHTASETPAIKDIAEKINRMDETGRAAVLNGWDGDFCIQVKQSDIFRIYSADKKVYMEAETKASTVTNSATARTVPTCETLLVKMRLYEFEELAEKCGWTDFIRISNTDIVNFSKVTKLDMSLSGIIKVNFTNGSDAIVSRRYMNKIKDQLNMVKKTNERSLI